MLPHFEFSPSVDSGLLLKDAYKNLDFFIDGCCQCKIQVLPDLDTLNSEFSHSDFDGLLIQYALAMYPPSSYLTLWAGMLNILACWHKIICANIHCPRSFIRGYSYAVPPVFTLT